MARETDNFDANYNAARAALDGYIDDETRLHETAEAITGTVRNPGDADWLSNKIIGFAIQYRAERKGSFV